MSKKHKSNAIVPMTEDPIFKEIFTCPECHEYTCKLLSYFTGIEYEYLLDNLVVKNTELLKTNKNERRKTTDVLLSVDGNMINLEMNRTYYTGLYERNDFFQSNLLSRLPIVSEEYAGYKSVLQINFDLFNKFEKVISEFRVMEVDTHELENESYRKLHINLFKIRKMYYDGNEKEAKGVDKLLAFLVASNKKELERISKGDKTLMKAKDKVEKLSEDDAFSELLSDEFAEKMQKMEEHYLTKYYSEISFKDGETSKSKETAKKMLEKDFDMETIQEITGLTKEEIEKLK